MDGRRARRPPVRARCRQGGLQRHAHVPDARPAAIVDIDGTPVDSNYQHALAWFRGLRRLGVVCEARRLHRLIGVGGDHLVQEVSGADVERRHGDDIRAAEQEAFAEMIDEVTLDDLIAPLGETPLGTRPAPGR